MDKYREEEEEEKKRGIDVPMEDSKESYAFFIRFPDQETIGTFIELISKLLFKRKIKQLGV